MYFASPTFLLVASGLRTIQFLFLLSLSRSPPHKAAAVSEGQRLRQNGAISQAVFFTGRTKVKKKWNRGNKGNTKNQIVLFLFMLRSVYYFNSYIFCAIHSV
jgi:hypothetical protein